MSHTLSTYLAPLTVVFSLGLAGCSSVKTPDVLKKLSMPDITIPENHPSFRKRVYAGGSFGKSTLKPDTAGTSFTVANGDAVSSQFRLGIDLHNMLSVELDTSVLGTAEFEPLAVGVSEQLFTDVSYSSASISALFYGLTGVKNRSSRIGWSGYGRLGYGIVKHGSIVEPFDYSKNSLLVGVGAEYGFNNGLAMRADLTRVDGEVTVFGLGGIYRFGMAPERIGQVFVNAAKPALGAANTKVASGGQVLSGRAQIASGQARGRQVGGAHGSSVNQSMVTQSWQPKPTKQDIDGDGVLNAADTCAQTPLHTTVNSSGCGLFDAVLSDVTFKPGSAWLTPRARGALDALSVTLLAFPEARVQVRAHTDSDGPADLNIGLSARRAESVVTYLQEKGIAELQLETVGLGESQPLDTNETKEGKKRNRRVELLTLPNIDHQTLIDNEAMLAAVNIEDLGTAPKPGAPQTTVPWRADPVFPPMAGVKIEPLPKSAYVAGLSIGGILHDVKFVDGSTTLTQPSKNALKSVSQQLARFPSVKVVVMGHTDNKLSEELSKALSVKRANTVVNQLISLGTDASRLSAKGFGSSLPVAQNLTDADRQRNQRIELRVIE